MYQFGNVPRFIVFVRIFLGKVFQVKLFRIFAIAALAMASSASVQAAVVLSNMGSSGLDNTSGTVNVDIIDSGLIASGFETGSVAQQLDWVSIVAENNNPGTMSVQIFSNNAGNPGSSIATSTGTTVGSKNVYQFNFSGVTLTANTTYWVLPQSGLKWYVENTNTAPTAQNGSGFTYEGTRYTEEGDWYTSGFNYTIAVSTTSDGPPPPAPIPEPALTSLLCLSGIALIRRRMKK
jgi:hypothetical protein